MTEITEMPQARIDFQPSEHLPASVATNIVVQWTGMEIILTFFEAKPPIVLAPQDGSVQPLEPATVIRADPVGKLSIALPRMIDMIKALDTVVSNAVSAIQRAGEAARIEEAPTEHTANPK